MSESNDKPVAITIHGKPTRRQAIQWVMKALAASAVPGLEHLGGSAAQAQTVGRTVTPQENAAKQPDPLAKGYGADPDLLTPHKPGDFWPLTFTPGQKKTAAALADTIIPKDHFGPAASEVGVVEMLDEWVSAPYPAQQADRPVILNGLAWIEAEAQKRFGKSFASIGGAQRGQICDDICHAADAPAQFKEAAGFFSRFRSICAGAYYATPAGWKAIGYVGNVALPQFDGPPPEVLAKLGVTQTVA
jgi:hypothetical protein